jgi:hypothetical protein
VDGHRAPHRRNRALHGLRAHPMFMRAYPNATPSLLTSLFRQLRVGFDYLAPPRASSHGDL